MAFPIKYFQGEINNKKSSDFIAQLDFTLGQDDRVKLANDILYTDKIGENKYLDKYFQIYFDKKFKYNPKKTDFLSSDNSVCNSLESMANYILFADDAEKVKNTEYNFYTLEQLKDRFGRELSVDELVEKTYSDVRNEQSLSFLLDKGKNFKKSTEQNITHNDIVEIEPICNYEEYKMALNKKLINLRKSGKDKALQRKIVRMLKDIKSDQIYCKDKIKGTIYFKSPLHDSIDIDYEQFNNYDPEQVKALLECNGTLLTDVGCLKYDLMQLVENVDFDEREREILNLLLSGFTSFEISKELDLNHRYILSKTGSIAKKIIREFNKSLDEWYYTFKVKGTFKKCTKCNEILIANNENFGVDKRNKDSYRIECRECRKR